MTEAMYYVLLALMNPNHGYQLMHSIMQKEGLIVLEEDDGRRKTYKVTKEGEHALQAEYNRLRNMVRDGNVLKEGDLHE